MEAVLQHISMVPGVIGCILCTGDGQPLAQSFPATLDPSIPRRTTAVLAEIADNLKEQPGSGKLIDMNYDVGRIIVKQLSEGFLAVLCANTINVQVLTITLNVAQNKINTLMQFRKSNPVGHEPVLSAPPAPPQPVLAQPVDRPLRRDGKGVILTIDSMKVSAKIKWDQMEENIAISTSLALELQNLYKISSIKKIKAINIVAGCSKTFNVRTYERDDEHSADDKIALTLAAAEALQAKPGDEISVEPVSGGGFFSWG